MRWIPIAFLCTVAGFMGGTGSAHQSYEVLLHLSGEGGLPRSGVLQGRDGKLYGTASTGGVYGQGAVFSLNPDGSGFANLHSFDGQDGAFPKAELVEASDGFFYGTTVSGGSTNAGTIFRFAADRPFETVHVFDATDPAGGSGPSAALIESGGYLYGTTESGGADGGGTVYRLDISAYPTVTFEVIHSFGLSTATGGTVEASTLVAANGYLFGTTVSGGANGWGTIFRLDPDGANYQIVHDFSDGGGIFPHAGLIAAGGYLYGTTQQPCDSGTLICGTVFRLDASGADFQQIHAFNAADGFGAPVAPVRLGGDGALYGTAEAGGAHGGGVVFKIDISVDPVTVRRVHEFANATTGSRPQGGVLEAGGFLYVTAWTGGPGGAGTLIRLPLGQTPAPATILHSWGPVQPNQSTSTLVAVDGALYGTSNRGGLYDAGAIYEVGSSGALRIVHSFQWDVDGGSQISSLVRGADGNLYGAAAFGGPGQSGTVFKVDPQGSAFQLLRAFDGGPASGGANPAGVIEIGGQLFGTALGGGDHGGGTVFAMAADGSNFRVLHSFDSTDPKDGAEPAGALIQASDGRLYGTTRAGGAFGDGTIYRLDTGGGGLEVLHSFEAANPADGGYPAAGLTQGGPSLFFGTTTRGGLLPARLTDWGGGTVFMLDTSTSPATFTLLRAFEECCISAPAGSAPHAALVRGAGGWMYGTTSIGGAGVPGAVMSGTVFGIDRSGAFKLLHTFDDANGAAPFAALTVAGDGSFYGVTAGGGTFKGGTVFHLSADSDADGVLQAADNCPLVPNADQADVNGDGVGDACAAAPVLSLSVAPSQVSFGGVDIDASATRTLTVANSGGGAIALGTITVAGTNAAEFTVVTTCGSVLAAAASCGIDVTFSPVAAGARTATLTLAHSAGSGLVQVQLQGTGVVVSTLIARDDTYTVAQDRTLASGTSRLAQYPFDPRFFTRIESLTAADGILFFIDSQGRLSRTDGTAAGTVALISGARMPQKMAAIDGTVFFVRQEPATGLELWKSDGTAGGTVLVKDIIPGREGSWPHELTVVDGTLFFAVDTIDPLLGVIGFEIWKSDGTTAGTSRVRAFAPAPQGDKFLRNVAGTLYFYVRFLPDRGLWKTDGTPAGTVRVRDIRIDGRDFDPRHSPLPLRRWYPNVPVVVGDKLVFLGLETGSNPDLWVADASGARVLVPHGSDASRDRYFIDFAEVNGRLYFSVADLVFSHTDFNQHPPLSFYFTSQEIWSSDGTPQGTSLVKTFGPVLTLPIDEPPFFFTSNGGDVFFLRGSTLWKTDGTPNGTVSVYTNLHISPGGSTAAGLTDVDGTWYFDAQSLNLHGLWKSDGTTAGTVLAQPIEAGYNAFDITNVDGTIFFTIPYDDARGNELRLLGTAPGVMENDTRGSSPATAALAQPPAHGSVALNPDGTFVYRPNAGFTGDDAFTYTLTDGIGTSAPATATIHVTAVPPRLSVSDAAIQEGYIGSRNLIFTVTRSGNVSAATTVSFATGGGSATPGTDYGPVSGTLTFAPGETSQQVLVPVYGDTLDEPDEVVFLNLSSPVGGTLLRTRVAGTIVGDDFDSDVQLAVTATPDPVSVGESLRYQVVVTNNGPRAATGVGVTMPVDITTISAVGATSPAGFCVVPFIAIGGTSPVTCDGGSLAPGASVTITIDVTPKTAGTLTSAFTVSAQQTDPVPANNTVVVGASVTAPRTIADAGGVRYQARNSAGLPVPVVVQFTAIDRPGILVANPLPVPPPPPAEWSFISGVFDVTTTASFSGAVTVCIGGAGLMPQDRLLHFEGARWTDVTTGSAAPGEICGQSASLSPFGIARDVRPPAIAIASPQPNATYQFGETVAATYTCADGGTGVAACSGPVASGQRLDTSSVGARAFTVNARDLAGNINSASVTYNVVCDYVALTLAPSTVKTGGVVGLGARLRSCANAPQTIMLRFTLSAPAKPGGCGSVNTVMLTTPAMTLPAGFDRTFSYDFRVPKSLCTGAYSVTVATIVDGGVVQTASTTLTVIK